MTLLTESVLRAVCPRVSTQWLEPLRQATERFEIDTSQRLAAFLAQVAHESNELRRVVEDLHYSAERIARVWPSRFPSARSAEPYAFKPEALANKVYASRLGNGNAASGDGWRYRGRGPIQLTGRGNYRRVGGALALELVERPEMVERPIIGSLTAAYQWWSLGLNELADDASGITADDFIRITERIAGGRTGLRSRMVYWDRSRAALGVVKV